MLSDPVVCVCVCVGLVCERLYGVCPQLQASPEALKEVSHQCVKHTHALFFTLSVCGVDAHHSYLTKQAIERFLPGCWLF